MAVDAHNSRTRTEGPRVVLYLEYDGSRYRGSQLQRVGTATIQGAVEDAIYRLTGTRCRVTSASRTDAGVDALGQVMSFTPPAEMSLRVYEAGLNYYLPRDIVITAVFWAPMEFDVARSAVSRTYCYTILNRRTRPAVLRNRAAHVAEFLDTDRMDHAARALKGWMDVRPFTGPLSTRRNPLRLFDHAAVTRHDDVVTIEMEANGFLAHQIRRTVSALVRVGTGRLTIEEFQRIAESGRPGEVTWTMPPEGLCLVRVRYDGFPPEDGNDDGTN